MNLFTAKWPFPVSAVMLALLAVASLILFREPIGLSDAVTAVTDFRDGGLIHGELPEPPPMDWQAAMLFGLVLGAALASLTGGNFKLEFSEEGDGSAGTFLRTAVTGVCGGFLVMSGIQLAGDTVWGQFSAAIQLSSGAWLFLTGMLLTGIVLAVLWDHRTGGKTGAKSKAEKGRRR